MDGNLATTSFEQLGHDLAERRATGTLRITHGTDDVRVFWRDGVVVGAAGTTIDSRLGDRLVHSRLLSRDNLTAALASQAGSDKPLGALLIDDSLVNEHVVKVFVQEQILDALFWPVRWTTGDFTFTAEEVRTHRPAADMTFGQLLYALESRHRTWDEVTHTIPTTAAVPEFVPGADPSMAALEAGQNAVLAAVDGRRSMAEIADDLGFSTYEVGVILHGLAVLGLVRLQKSDERTTEPSATEAPDAPVLTPPPPTAASEGVAEVPTPRTEESHVEEPDAFVLSVEDEPTGTDEGLEPVTSDFFGGGSRRDLLSAPSELPTPEPTTPEPATPEPATPSATQPAASSSDLPISSAPASSQTDSFFDPNADVEDDLEVWTMEIGGDDTPAEPKSKKEPRASEPTPIAAPVTPTPDPEEPEEEPPPTPPKPSGSGDVSDLLRELRQLSDD